MADLENDVTPNDSEALGVYIGDEDSQTPEQEQEQVEERQVMTSMVPFIKELFEWFEECIDGADSISSITQTKKTFKDFNLTTDQLIVCHSVVASMFETKREEFAARFENFQTAHADERAEDQEDSDE